MVNNGQRIFVGMRRQGRLDFYYLMKLVDITIIVGMNGVVEHVIYIILK